MAWGFLASLFGCTQTKDHGSWTRLIVSNLSPDRLDSYSFRVEISDGDGMILYGYCYDDENEYRADEGLILSSETANRLRSMGIEKLSTYNLKRKTWPFKAVDTVERIAQVTYEDGTEFAIFLSNEQRDTIVSLLSSELIAALCAEKHGEWQKLELSRSGGDDYSNYFWFSLEQSAGGQWLVSGDCPGADGIRYESEDGVPIADETVAAIRSMKLEGLAVEFPMETDEEEPLLLDGETDRLTLYFADGYSANKNIGSKMQETLYDLLRKDFTASANPS